MVRRPSEAKRLEWVDRLARHATSRLSVSAFCRQESISEANFYHWKRKLGGKGRSRSHRRSLPAPPQFVELQPGTIAMTSHVEITTVSGAVIRVPAQQVGAIEAVVKALDSIPIHGVAGCGADA